MCDEMDIFKDQYDQEIALIKANGNDRSALKIRYEQYRIHERELLDYIKRRTLEQAGRSAALKHITKKIVSKSRAPHHGPPNTRLKMGSMTKINPWI